MQPTQMKYLSGAPLLGRLLAAPTNIRHYYAECHYAEYCYAQFGYAQYGYAERHEAIFINTLNNTEFLRKGVHCFWDVLTLNTEPFRIRP
jgi:hypothetical protein